MLINFKLGKRERNSFSRSYTLKKIIFFIYFFSIHQSVLNKFHLGPIFFFLELSLSVCISYLKRFTLKYTTENCEVFITAYETSKISHIMRVCIKVHSGKFHSFILQSFTVFQQLWSQYTLLN